MTWWIFTTHAAGYYSGYEMGVDGSKNSTDILYFTYMNKLIEQLSSEVYVVRSV